MHNEPMSLEILFESETLVAINKPHGLLVHKSRIASDATEFALQLLRDQLGQKVHLAHRLDRKTSGVLLFSKNKEMERRLHQLFRERKMKKKYLAIVRGYTEDHERINYALQHEGKTKEAITDYETLERFAIPLPTTRYSTSRYSYIRLKPETGRFHQLRKHMAHIRHPILGDRPHGCNKQNKLWKEHFGLDKMLLHAAELEFELDKIRYVIKAQPNEVFRETLIILRSQKL